jgi:myo-inositol 2-dehydrogenase/D-chiro-inositol 1-dehydrogenase
VERSDDVVRYGVIGTGMMGVEHIRNVNALDGAVVTAIADPHAPSRASGAQAADGDVAVFESHVDLLASGECDAVVIASPNVTHVDLLRDVLPAPVHVMIEKPLCTTVADCERVLDLAAERPDHLVTWMAMEYRYMPAAAELIRLVHDGAVGTPRMVAIREHRFPFLVKVDNWNRFSENTGGTLVEKTCHFFDLMMQITGARPVRVFASGDQSVNHLDESYDGETPDMLDNAYVIIDFDDGSRGLLDLCMFAEASVNEQEIVVTGDVGKMEALVTESILRIGKRADGQHVVDTHHIHHDGIKHVGLHHGSSYLEHVDFAETIRSHAAPKVTLMDGLRSAAIGFAAHRSIETGLPVRMDELAELEGLDW